MPQDFELHGSYTYWISRLASVMRESFNASLKEAEISWPQWMTLNCLHHQRAQTPAALAECLGVDRSAITRLLDRLADKQLVVRDHDDGDRRSVRVSLTEAGSAKMSAIDDAAREHQNAFLSHLPATEVRAFKGNLQKLLRAGGVETTALWRNLE
ncbi:MarR family winged helix-turn-helix transcriptional regulator [Gilvimarinus agarilyticus]|uniref:MarR family winged helix-turn-helix transcriptional regulator n=1 Tax=Gilvimarinus agarilyticus TaxID=679259 RepID=UPI000698978B|nr:MarR family transcriptional regulator [Gilvimarinus agarilyticus]